MILIITIASLIAATILGWVAVGQIRRSAGKLHGMGLAVFAGLLLPLLVLDAAIGGIVTLSLLALGNWLARGSVRGAPSTLLVLLLSFPVIVLLDVLIVRYVWRKVNPTSDARQAGGSSIGRILAIGCASIVGLVVLLGGVFVLLRFAFMPRAVSVGPQPHMMFNWASVLLGGLFLALVVAVVGLIVFLLRKKSSGTGGALAVGCGVAAVAGLILVVLVALGMFLFIAPRRVVINDTEARQVEMNRARADAERQMAEARARAEQQMAESRARAAQQPQPVPPQTPFFRIESSRALSQADPSDRRINFMRLDNSVIMTLRRQTNAPEFQADEFAWMRKQNVDVRPWFTITNQHIREAGLESVDMLVAKISPAYPTASGPGSWSGITPELVLNALREEAKSWPYPTATRTLAMRDNAGQSIAWAFRTRNGDQGVLQIVGFGEKPNTVSIRYKLLSPDAGGIAGVPDQTNAAIRSLPSPIRRTATNEISIAEDGSITVAGKPCGAEELPQRLAALAKATDGVLIQADRSVPMSRVLEVMTACKRAGITNVNVSGTISGLLEDELAQTDSFQFRWVAAEGDTNSPADMLPDASDTTGQRRLRVLHDVAMSSADVDSAGLSQSQGDQKELAIFLSPRGGEKFAKLTRENLGRRLAIVWQGRVLSAPVIRAEVSGRRVSITGRFTDAEAQKLLDALNKRQSAAATRTNAPTQGEFYEYVVGKTFEELASTSDSRTPEAIQASAAIGVLNGDPATVLRRHTLDVMTFPPGGLKLTISEEGRAKTLRSRVLRCVIFRGELAVVIFEQAGALNSVVQGRRNGEWKIFTTAELADTGTEVERVQTFKAKAPKLLTDLRNLPAQPPSLEEKQRREFATNLNAGVNSLLSTLSQIVSNSGGSIHFGTPIFVGSGPVSSVATNNAAAVINADLKARLGAAASILSFTERDKALAAIAYDAAKAGECALASQAVESMTSFTARDKAALEAARELVKTGHRAEAIELAKTITAFTQRDAALKELAQ